MSIKNTLLFSLLMLIHAPLALSKEKSIEHLNLTIDFKDGWMIKDHPAADLALMNITTGEAVVIHKVPLSTFNARNQLPENLDEFKTYIKENYLQSQMNVLSGMINDQTTFKKNVRSNGLQGPLINMQGKINNTGMTFYMWMAWQGNGVLMMNYVSPAYLDRTESDFRALIKNLSITNDDLNPFLVNNQISLNEQQPPLLNQQFGVQLAQFNDFMLVDSKELEVSKDEHFYTFMLINQKNGDFIFSVPHCFAMDESLQQATLRSIASNWLEAAYNEGHFEHAGQQIPYISAEGVSDDIKQLSLQATFKKTSDCLHAIVIASSTTIEGDANLKLVYEHLTAMPEGLRSVSVMDGVYDKGYANYYSGMATMLEESGHDVSPFYAAAHQFDPSLDNLNLLLAQHNTAGHYQQGLSTIKAASQANKDHPVILSWQAWFQQKTEAYDAAIDTYARLFATDHQSDEDLLTYVGLLENKQRWSEATAVMQQQIEHMTRRSTGLGKLIKFAGYSQQEDTVNQTLKLLQDEQRIDLDNIYDVLDGLYEVKQIDTLMALLDEQLKSYPDHVGLTFYKGDIQYVTGEHEQALKTMERAHQLSPDNERIEQYLKDIQLNLGLGNYQLVSQPIKAVSKPAAFDKEVSQLTYRHPDSDVEYLYYAVGYEFTPGKQLSTSHYRKFRINNSKGVERYKTLTFEFDQSHEEIYLNEFRVLAEDGSLLQEIDRKSVYLTNNPDGITADDDMVVNIPVPQIRPGVEIEFVITTQSKGNRTTIPYSKHFFAASNPIAYEAVFITGDTTGIDSVSRDPLTENHSKNVLMWSTTATREMVFHSMMPQLEEISNWLIIGPAGQTWEAIGQEYLTMIKDKVNTDISRARKLAIFGDARSADEKILKAAQFIQQKINYQALEFGTRALIPNTAQQTLDNGYGDCKDHAVLLADLLNSAGVRAHLALVQTRRSVHEKIPALDQFNHAVVYLPDHHGGMYIDTTDKELSIGAAFPPENLQGTTALILDPEQPRLSQVPRGQAKDNTIVVDRELKKSLNHIEITDTIMMTGYKASGMRYSLKNNASNELQKNVQSWIGESYSELELVSFDYYGLDNNQEPLIMELKTRIKADQSPTTLPFFIEKNYLDLNHSNQRQDDYEVRSPFVFTSTTSVPPEFTIEQHHKEPVASVHQATEWEISTQPGKLLFKAENQWYKGSPESYNDYVSTMKKAIKQLEQSIQLEQ